MTPTNSASGSPERVRAAIATVMVVSMPIVFFLLGLLVPRMWRSGAFVSWRALSDPPERARAIAAADEASVTIATASGALYACAPGGSGACWAPVDQAPAARRAAPCATPLPIMKPEPFEDEDPVDSVDIQVCRGNTRSQVSYAVGDDGSVWRWQHTLAAEAGPGAIDLLAPVGGALFGLGDGLLVAWLLMRRQTRLEPWVATALDAVRRRLRG